MKKFKFLYQMNLDFSIDATNHSYTLRCMPRSDERQLIHYIKMELSPPTTYQSAMDSLGNAYIYGKYISPHKEFQIRVVGEVDTGLQPYLTEKKPQNIGMFRVQTPCTAPGPAIEAFYKKNYISGGNPLECTLDLMHKLYDSFTYESGSTRVESTAEEAMAQGKGVCQDYSHIMLSLCRKAGIPARYIVGMLEGEGASHAWIEIYQNGKWYALDPTNNLIVDDIHMKISHGRDYKDCAINKGLLCGGGCQKQSVTVVMEELS